VSKGNAIQTLQQVPAAGTGAELKLEGVGPREMSDKAGKGT